MVELFIFTGIEVYNYKVEGDKKALRLELDKLELSTSLNDNLFFIYVK